jgi:hypothetical protein
MSPIERFLSSWIRGTLSRDFCWHWVGSLDALGSDAVAAAGAGLEECEALRALARFDARLESVLKSPGVSRRSRYSGPTPTEDGNPDPASASATTCPHVSPMPPCGRGPGTWSPLTTAGRDVSHRTPRRRARAGNRASRRPSRTTTYRSAGTAERKATVRRPSMCRRWAWGFGSSSSALCGGAYGNKVCECVRART